MYKYYIPISCETNAHIVSTFSSAAWFHSQCPRVLFIAIKITTITIAISTIAPATEAAIMIVLLEVEPPPLPVVVPGPEPGPELAAHLVSTESNTESVPLAVDCEETYAHPLYVCGTTTDVKLPTSVPALNTGTVTLGEL